MKYTKASAEVVLFDNSDVVTASNVDWTDPGAGWEACGMPSLSQNGECSRKTWN